jgi:hypothetical protein
MTLAILNFSGKRPVARDWLKMCLRGVRISVDTFLRMQEEIPVMSGFNTVPCHINYTPY